MIKSPRSEFSHRTRAYNIARLRAELFDILVIGGGITGAGIAREAALRGYKVALVEKNDFASGASSQSSKLIHGGIRYLETFQFHLVYEASTERRRLLHLAPQHVWPLPFLYPIYRNNRYGPFLINVGLWMYDGLALFRNVDRHHMLSTQQIAAELPGLDMSNIVGGARYHDAAMDDARLALETIRSAHQHGAVIVNHAQVEQLTRNKGKRVDGIIARDLLGRDAINVRARVIVNATGPWTDAILELDAADNAPRLRPTKGIHLLVPREKFPLEEAVAFSAKGDGRLMFVIPRGDYALIGTTDTLYSGNPDRVSADAADVTYVLDAVAKSFPGVKVQRNDVLSTFAGLRPLLGTAESVAPGAISREHQIWRTPSGLVNIAGGKYTTYRAMAQGLVDKVSKLLRRDFGVYAPAPSRSAVIPLVEMNGSSENAAQHNLRGHADVLRSLSDATRLHLLRAYGERQGRVLDYVLADPKLRAPIVDGFPYIWAEVPHAVEREMALTVSDVMMRRLHLFHEVRDGAVVAARDVALYMARLLDWITVDIDRQVAAYADEVERNRGALKND